MGFSTESLAVHFILPLISRYFTSLTRGGRKKIFVLILTLIGNSPEIGGKMKTGFSRGEIENFFKKIPGYFRKKVDFQVNSGLFPGVIGIIWIQYATYFHLDPI